MRGRRHRRAAPIEKHHGQFPDRRLDTSVSSSSFPAQMTARWVVLPVFGAHLAHAPVLRFDLLPKLARPIDGAKTFHGRRLFGANKTWRGAAALVFWWPRPAVGL